MGQIVKVSGPLVVATGMEDANMADVVRVGEQQLIGEILNMSGDSASIQVYEETSGLGPGAEVVTTGSPLAVELGPGLIENICRVPTQDYSVFSVQSLSLSFALPHRQTGKTTLRFIDLTNRRQTKQRLAIHTV